MEKGLTIGDRLTLINMLPQQGSRTLMSQVQAITNKVRLSNEEIEKYDFKEELKSQPDGRTSIFISVNPEYANVIVPIEFDSVEVKIFEDAVKSLDEKKEITIPILDVIKSLSYDSTLCSHQ